MRGSSSCQSWLLFGNAVHFSLVYHILWKLPITFPHFCINFLRADPNLAGNEVIGALWTIFIDDWAQRHEIKEIICIKIWRIWINHIWNCLFLAILQYFLLRKEYFKKSCELGNEQATEFLMKLEVNNNSSNKKGCMGILLIPIILSIILSCLL